MEFSFVDDKKVKTKGSEVGFSLAKIEKVLELKRQLIQEQSGTWKTQKDRINFHEFEKPGHQHKTEDQIHLIGNIKEQIQTLLFDLTRVEYRSNGINNEFKIKRKKKYKRKGWSR
ncbi:hypothetical protein A5893_16730 [Pedobacter psychrophilus]|uniref:Uncharacterized protein n=1 Tax=Pedobacter psychrophilus TaxID=1826909 RepID=A0A179DAI9_9SPHI|nr:hypothetical protein [Pedobacter psychrophilus]OAQ38008.1 hypothetical protein A5893_16730 [Pedobacter psychrophilus]